MSDEKWIPEWNKSCLFNNSPNIPNEFAMIILGTRRSGKTTLLLKMLLQKDFLDYNKLLIISPTTFQPKIQMLYYGFKNKLSKESIKAIFMNQEKFKNMPIPALCEYYANQHPENNDIECVLHDKISEIPSPASVHKMFKTHDENSKTLVVLDDCIDEVQNTINKYFTKSRHYNINVIYLSQSLTKLDKNTVRGNANFFIALKQPITDLKRLFREYVSADKNELEDFIQRCNGLFKKDYVGKYLAVNLENGKITDNIFEDIVSDSEED